MCECMTWARATPDDLTKGQHHHPNCPKYETEKFPYLFYYEEAHSAWMPWVDGYDFSEMLDALCFDGDKMEIQFVRRELTDKEIDELPED